MTKFRRMDRGNLEVGFLPARQHCMITGGATSSAMISKGPPLFSMSEITRPTVRRSEFW